MASVLKLRAGGVLQWEVKAKRDMAIWRQHLPIARAIAHSNILVRCAENNGVATVQIQQHQFEHLMESPIFNSVRQEAEKEMKRWEGNRVEEIVHAGFLVDAAKEAGIDVERVRDAPFFKGPARRDQDVQVSFPCI